jgi:hypothetical protein
LRIGRKRTTPRLKPYPSFVRRGAFGGFGAVEVFREPVGVFGRPVGGIAHFELLGGEFEVEIEYLAGLAVIGTRLMGFPRAMLSAIWTPRRLLPRPASEKRMESSPSSQKSPKRERGSGREEASSIHWFMGLIVKISCVIWFLGWGGA